MIEASWLTRHERGVLIAALRPYVNTQRRKSTQQADARDRANASANLYTATALLQQLADR